MKNNKSISVINNQKRWFYIPLGLIIFMCMGTIYSWSIFRKAIENSFNIGATESGMPYMFFLVFYALAMPFAGSYMDKYGPKVMTIIGGLFISIGWFLSGFTNSILMLTISYGIIGGTGVGIAYGAPMAVAAKWFPDKEGLAVGLTLGGFGLSPFITAPAAGWLIRNFGALTDKFKAKTTAIISFSLIILASVLMLINNSSSQVLYFIAFSIFWLNLGGWLAIAPAATSYFFGKKITAKIMAICLPLME